MIMPFGKYKGQPLSMVPESYAAWVYGEYKPLLLEIERTFKIMTVEKRSEKVELELLIEAFQKQNPELEVIEEIKEAIIEKFYSGKRLHPKQMSTVSFRSRKKSPHAPLPVKRKSSGQAMP